MIAGKFEEKHPENVSDYVWMSAGSFNAKELIAMEERVLKSLDYHLVYVTPLHYAKEMAQDFDKQVQLCTEYFCILSTFDVSFSYFDAYEIATLSFQLAFKVVNGEGIPDEKITRNLEKSHEQNQKVFRYFKRKGLKDIVFTFESGKKLKLSPQKRVSPKKKKSPPSSLPKSQF